MGGVQDWMYVPGALGASLGTIWGPLAIIGVGFGGAGLGCALWIAKGRVLMPQHDGLRQVPPPPSLRQAATASAGGSGPYSWIVAPGVIGVSLGMVWGPLGIVGIGFGCAGLGLAAWVAVGSRLGGREQA